MSIVMPRSRSALSLSSTHAYLNEPLPISAASFSNFSIVRLSMPPHLSERGDAWRGNQSGGGVVPHESRAARSLTDQVAGRRRLARVDVACGKRRQRPVNARRTTRGIFRAPVARLAESDGHLGYQDPAAKRTDNDQVDVLLLLAHFEPASGGEGWWFGNSRFHRRNSRFSRHASNKGPSAQPVCRHDTRRDDSHHSTHDCENKRRKELWWEVRRAVGTPFRGSFA